MSIKDVAALAGVSIATVSRVMNGSSLVKGEAREAVLRAARELNYVPHAAARALSTGRSHTIAVLLPDLHGAFFSELIRELDQSAHAHGQRLLVASLHGDLAEAKRVIGLIHGQVDGVILMAPFIDAQERLADLRLSVPTVLLNAPSSIQGYTVLTVDNAGGARQVVEHFLSQGYCEVIHIEGPPGNFDAAERSRGFREAIEEAGLTAQPNVPGDYSERAGYEAGKRIAGRKKRPRAIFAANDNMAIGCLEALTEAGLRVPQDVAIAGFDDIPVARFTRPPLTTVRPPVAQQGTEAFEWLVRAINRKPSGSMPEHPRLATTLVVRESSGAGVPSRQGSNKNRPDKIVQRPP